MNIESLSGILRIILLTVVIFLVSYGSAEITLPSLFTNGVVFQQNTNASVWGWASEGQTISITPSWNNQTYTAVTDSEGYWKTKITTPVGSTNTYSIVFSDNLGSSKTISGVLIGEVWICSGQSNMEMLVKDASNASIEINDADYPFIKIFKVPYKASYTPEKNVSGNWVSPTSQTVLNSYFGAIPFFFSRNLYKTLNVPIGIIHAAKGSASQSAWLSEENIKGANYAENVLREALTGNMPEREQHIPTVLYNGMLKPLVPYTVRGVCWYQGEHDIVQPDEYKLLLDNFINSWRKELEQPELPFLITQLSGYAERNNDAWTSVQEIQYNISQKYSNIATIMTYDIGEPTNIHPSNKQDVAYRMCLAARKMVYEEDILVQGASIKKISINGSTVGLSYKDTGTGLVLKEGVTANHFMLAGADKVFYDADASIVAADSIVLSNADVPYPKYVRYAYKNYNSSVNLHNSTGIPAIPFRTDTTLMLISSQSGEWNDISTWGEMGVPSVDDDVVIAVGHTVTNYVSGAITKDLCKSLTVNGTLHVGNKTQSNYITNVYGHIVCNGKIDLGEAVKGAYLTFKSSKAELTGTGTATLGSINLASGYTNCLISMPTVKVTSSLQINSWAAKFIIGSDTNITGYILSPSSTAGQSNNYGYYDIYGKATFDYVYLCNNYSGGAAKNEINLKHGGELMVVRDVTPMRNGSTIKGIGGSGTILSVENGAKFNFPSAKDPFQYTVPTHVNYDKNLSVNYYNGSILNGMIITDDQLSGIDNNIKLENQIYYDRNRRILVFHEPVCSLTIYNMMGQVIYTNDNPEQCVELSNKYKGICLVLFTNKINKTEIVKVFIS